MMSISTGVLAGILFSLFVVLVAFVISVLLYRDLRSLQKVYAGFSGQLNEFIAIMTKDGCLQNLMPNYVDDPLYKRMAQSESFESILSISDLNRLNDYIRGLDAYPDIPFAFSYNGEQGVLWYALRAFVQKIGNDSQFVYLIKNVTLDVESRNQRDRIQKKMDMLLQGTGDFLWNLDVEKRQFSLLSPLTDEDGHVVPRSMGIQDINTLLPEMDYKFFAKTVNSRIVDFRASGGDHEEYRSFKVRLYGQNGNLVWYSFRCKVVYDENGRLMINGVARRMDVLMETSLLDDKSKDALLSSIFSFPEIGIFCLDRDFKVVACNQTFALDHGSSSGKVFTGRDFKDVFHSKLANLFIELSSTVFEKGLPVSWKGSLGMSDTFVNVNATPVEKNHSIGKVLFCYSYSKQSDFDDNNDEKMEKK